MSENAPDEITVEIMFHALSNYFKVKYEELLNVLHEEKNYKRLLKIGEKQFFDAPNESSIEAESRKSRLCFAKINMLAVDLDDDIDKIIKEKLHGDLKNTLKEEVLRAVLDLSSPKQMNSMAVSSLGSKSPAEQKKNADLIVREKIKDLTKYCAQNMNDIRKQVNAMPVDEIEVIETGDTKDRIQPIVLECDKADSDSSNMSFGAVSSVHTSDLSSFDDEISLTSDEESGIHGKKVPLKEVELKIKQEKDKSVLSSKDNQQVESSIIKEEKVPESSINDSLNGFQKSQRKRKPNSKYDDFELRFDDESLKMKSADDAVVPLAKKSAADASTVSSPAAVNSREVPRKRGRPRKYADHFNLGIDDAPLKRKSTDDAADPLRKESSDDVSAVSSSAAVNGKEVPRKRGRPRKHPT